jgi:long-chain-fatty-acid--CoA ligase ACSBG
VWEKFEEAMVAIGRETTGVKKMISTWAKDMGRQHSQLSQYGAGGGAPCMYSCKDKKSCLSRKIV